MTQALPTVAEYKVALDHHVDMGDITVDQGVILLTAYVNHLSGRKTHVKAFMDRTGLDWRNVHYQINGLVQRGALKKDDKYWYGI
mgnify:CR=1 FL=1